MKYFVYASTLLCEFYLSHNCFPGRLRAYHFDRQYILPEESILEIHKMTSNYCPSHKCFSLKNKQVSGKFKDETGGIPIAEFCGLRAKSYSILLDDTYTTYMN
jgi:hypothetical protein